MKQAAFSLKDYKFDHVLIDLKNAVNKEPLNIDILPSGKFHTSSKVFTLSFCFTADCCEKRVIEVNCESTFQFKDVDSFDDIPSYFYSNSIAIIFPYVRAFISTLSLQANYMPIVLPTMNLSDLDERLKSKVTVVE